jgi:hypothetical protein
MTHGFNRETLVMRTAIVLETRLFCAPISRDRRDIESGSMTDERETILDQAGRDRPREYSSSLTTPSISWLLQSKLRSLKLRCINEERYLPFLTVVYP